MPQYKEHLIGAFVAYGLLLGILSLGLARFTTLLEWLLCALAGGLFPDVDIKSFGQKLLYRILFVLSILCVIQKDFFTLALISTLGLAPLLVKHRGIFHNLWFLCLLSGSTVGAAYMYRPSSATIVLFDVLFFMAGALSHLWLDMGTRRMLRLR